MLECRSLVQLAVSVLLYDSNFAKTERLLTRKHQSAGYWLDAACEVIQLSPVLTAEPAQSRLPGHCPVKFCVFLRIPHDLSVLLRKQASSPSQETNPRLRLFVALPLIRGSQAPSSPLTLQGWVLSWRLSTALPAEHPQSPACSWGLVQAPRPPLTPQTAQEHGDRPAPEAASG